MSTSLSISPLPIIGSYDALVSASRPPSSHLNTSPSEHGETWTPFSPGGTGAPFTPDGPFPPYVTGAPGSLTPGECPLTPPFPPYVTGAHFTSGDCPLTPPFPPYVTGAHFTSGDCPLTPGCPLTPRGAEYLPLTCPCGWYGDWPLSPDAHPKLVEYLSMLNEKPYDEDEFIRWVGDNK